MNEDLIEKALSGDKEATRMYCGSYTLVRRITDGTLFRCKGDVPNGFIRIEIWGLKSVYDKDGFLLSKFWSLPRI